MEENKLKKEQQNREKVREIAMQALMRVANSKSAPAAAVAAAARTLLESLGDIGRLQETMRQAEKPLTELSPLEIQQEIDRLKPKKD